MRKYGLWDAESNDSFVWVEELSRLLMEFARVVTLGLS